MSQHENYPSSSPSSVPSWLRGSPTHLPANVPPIILEHVGKYDSNAVRVFGQIENQISRKLTNAEKDEIYPRVLEMIRELQDKSFRASNPIIHIHQEYHHLAGVCHREFCVVHTENLTTPRVGEWLSETDLDRLRSSGVRTIVDPKPIPVES